MLPGTGLSGDLHHIAEVLNKDWPVGKRATLRDSDDHLMLGYWDDNYEDNGYYKHDNENYNQCQNIGPAWVSITITTPRTPPQSSGLVYSPGAKPFDLIWDVNEIDGNGLTFNSRWFAQLKDVDYKDVSVPRFRREVWTGIQNVHVSMLFRISVLPQDR
jgi:hypothetical protein